MLSKASVTTKDVKKPGDSRNKHHGVGGDHGLGKNEEFVYEVNQYRNGKDGNAIY
jgi:hypothetical protein